jgi:hypothetical protein
MQVIFKRYLHKSRIPLTLHPGYPASRCALLNTGNLMQAVYTNVCAKSKRERRKKTAPGLHRGGFIYSGAGWGDDKETHQTRAASVGVRYLTPTYGPFCHLFNLAVGFLKFQVSFLKLAVRFLKLPVGFFKQ